MGTDPERSKEFAFVILEVPETEQDLAVAILWECGTLGIEELPTGEVQCTHHMKAYFEKSDYADAGLALIHRHLPDVVVVDRGLSKIEDWVSLLHGGFEPVAVGPLLIVPAAAPPRPPTGAVLLKINPGLGFGTGTHPTTRLCLEFLCERLRPGAAVFDVGTGSGILAIAAALLGARQVLAVDIDPDALDNAAGNLKLNGVEDSVELRLGSIEQAGGRTFDLVLANILAVTVLQLLQQGLGSMVAPGGDLVLSGFAPEENERVAYALDARGFNVTEVRTSGQWAALLAEKPD